MVSVQKVQTGIANFVETEVTAQFSGWKKLVANTVVGLYLGKLPDQLQALSAHPMVSSLGLMQDGQVDIDALYAELAKHFSQPVAIDIPMLGTAQFTKENLDTLYRMIVNG